MGRHEPGDYAGYLADRADDEMERQRWRDEERDMAAERDVARFRDRRDDWDEPR